jgi:hypothetical protein
VLGREDQLGAAIRGVRAAFDVAELLEVIYDPPDFLLVPAGEARQLRRSDTILVEVGENRAMARVEIPVARLSETLEELVLQREEETAREHAQIRVPFLPLSASFRGRHKSR